ncbi:hypothetical protein [Aeromicrobium fastidiosum]|uniref:Uncharacterized protein n=1 Tax=Aeromicrobium fastidiosum TaxID=52699 RepID=A0A641AMH0_9ACTN|nr:hypothetical protein [Aeromicrobium fastidiosum]KAA1376124.1 hypothetical protein ESP62_011815 [Aeromicrobium fastidiosum]MBP2391996.1 F0F1-type ATP synthase assembly protein I [Aeromicrobium fastidiosum]
MSVPVAFYEAAAQVIPVLLLTEGVRAGLLLRDIRDVRRIEDENDAANNALTELEEELAELESQKAEMVLEAAVSSIPDSQRDHLKRILEKSDAVIAKAKKTREARDKDDARARRIANQARALETSTVALIGLTVLAEVLGIAVAMSVIASPSLRGDGTFLLVYAAICFGVAGVMQQLFHPLTIDKPKGRAQKAVNFALRWSPFLPQAVLVAGGVWVVN